MIARISSDWGLILAWVGLAVLMWRLKPWLDFQRASQSPQPVPEGPPVSIIIPCRNEEANIPSLIKSLQQISYPSVEIIVVDDDSTDQTAALAKSLQVKVVSAPPKPSHWSGKNWACWVGAQAATHPYLVFTDADTQHRPDSLQKVFAHLKENPADVISAPPFHECRNVWETLTGFFHLLPLIITNFRGRPAKTRLFAIGQYLLFKREVYFTLGGHQAIAPSLVDDMDLAELSLQQGFKYAVYPWADLFTVQMYGGFKAFLAGWKRLLRLGFKRSRIMTFLEVTLIFHLILFIIKSPDFLLTFVFLALIAYTQKNQGRFSLAGIFMIPVNALLFILLSLQAGWETFMKTKIQWRERSYIAAFLIVGLLTARTSMAETAELKIYNLRSGKGALAISLFSQKNEKAFPGEASKALKAIYLPLNGERTVNLKIEDIPAGTYAIAILHDENGNKKLDTNLVGVPKEGFGFSNNPTVFFGAPSFEKCSFRVKDSTEVIDIKMKYLL